MKKNNLIAVLGIAVLLLSGCSVSRPEVAQPVYDTAPAESGDLYVNGKYLKSYTAEETIYLRMDEFAEAMDSSLDVQPGIEEHECFLTDSTGNTTAYTTKTVEESGSSALGAIGGGLYDGSYWYQPEEDLLSGFDLHRLEDEEANCIYYTSYPEAEEIPEGVELPVMMYHAVSDNCWGIEELFVSPSSLREQLEGLQRNGYTTLWFEDLPYANRVEKPVVLTFDDGYEDNYTELFPIIQEYNVKVTIFLITGSIGTENYLNEDQIREMAASGLVSFQSHTVSHPRLTGLSAGEREEELWNAKLEVARITGKEPFVFCYPYGSSNNAVVEAVGQYYEFGLLMSGDTYVTGEDPLRINRKYVARSTDIESFGSMVSS